MNRFIPISTCLLFLGACASNGTPLPISANPIQDIKNAVAPTTGTNDLVTQGLLDASFNLHSAVTVGALSATDQVPACVDSVLTDLGINPDGTPTTQAQSFTPKVSDLISLGSVIYIRAQQAKKLQAAGLPESTSCDAVIGQIVRAAAKSGIKIGAGIVSGGIAAPILGVLP